MSYIVSKGIPKSCELCDIKPEKCQAIAAKVSRMDEDLWIPLNYRHDDCPLIEIKSPHGDLVDRSELLAEYDRQHKGPAGGARRIMERAEAVIEGERAEE